MRIKSVDGALGSMLLAATVLLGFFVEQPEFVKIISFYTIFFIAYILICFYQKHNSNSLRYYIVLAVLIRFILVFAFPNLSNDVYRFIWDGRLLVQGFNPFDHLPMYYLENEIGVEGITQELFQAYDEKNFYTVYPPVAQAQFGSACWLFPGSVYWAAVVMKLWLFIFEIGSICLIYKLLVFFKSPVWNTLWYALNPLIIFEIIGNLHFEGAMIFFLLLAVYLLVKNKWQLSAIAFAFSICAKLLTLMFLPFFIKKMGWSKSIRYYLLIGVTCAILFIPIVNADFFANFSESLNLYFQKLEFNASFYYLFRWVGFKIYGYNKIAFIGPVLAGVAGLFILYLAFIRQNKLGKKLDGINWPLLFKYWLFSICAYLFCTTTMHPWYVCLPIAVCVFTHYRFPILWSYLIFWTYINYSYSPYHENLWIVAFEYLILFVWLLKEYLTNEEKVISL